MARGEEIAYQAIQWRGSVTDLATDCAFLLDREGMREFIERLQLMYNETSPHKGKMLAKGWK